MALASRRLLASLPPHTKITLPALSPTMTQGGIAKWHKKEGDAIKPGETLAMIETDKASVDFEMQEDGFLAKILVKEGTSGVPVGSLIGIMVDDPVSLASFAKTTAADFGAEPKPAAAVASTSTTSKASPSPPSASPSAAPSSASTKAPSASPSAASPSSSSSSSSSTRTFASPLARKLAREAGVDVSQVSGTGPNGRIIASDVQQYQPPRPTGQQAAASMGPRSLPQGGLARNKLDAPHYYLNVAVNFTPLLQLRDGLNSGLAPSEVKLGVLDFIIKAAGLSMKHVPLVNSAWGDGNEIRTYSFCDVNISTVSGSRGVVAPLIRGIENSGLMDIAKRKVSILELAKSESLSADDLMEGTFSITDVGAFGVRTIVPIVRPGQAAALGVGVLQSSLVPGADTKTARVETVGILTLSCDHRLVDGAVGAQWCVFLPLFI